MILYWFQSLLAMFEDLPFRPVDSDENRSSAIGMRVAALLGLTYFALSPALHGTPLWGDEAVLGHPREIANTAALASVWRHPFRSATPPAASSLVYFVNRLRGPNVTIYRAVNLGFHVANVLLLWLILWRLEIRGAWFGAAIFAVHPLAVQPVAWLNQSSTCLAAFFSLASLSLFLRGDATDDDPLPEFWANPGDVGSIFAKLAPFARIVQVGLALLCYLLAILARPAATALPLMFVPLMLWRRRTLKRADLLRLVPYAFIAVASLVQLYRTSDGWAAARPAQASPFACIEAFFHTAGNILWPHSLQLLYPRTGMWSLPTTLAGLALLIAFFLPSPYRAPARLAVLGTAILLAAEIWWASRIPGLSPREGDSLRYDALGYLAIAPLAALSGAALVRLASRGSDRFSIPLLRMLLGIALIVPLARLTGRDSEAYGSPERLWKNVLAGDPHCTFARCRLTQDYLDQGDVDKAAAQVALFSPPSTLDPAEQWEALACRARVLAAQGHASQAAEQYRAALTLRPADRGLTVRFGEVCRAMGQIDEAIAIYDSALARAPHDPILQGNIGSLLLRRGRVLEAAEHLRLAVSLDPWSESARLNFANVLFAQGRLSEAAAQLQELTKRDPHSFEAFLNAGAMLGRLKDFENSERMLRAAVQLKPDSAEARNNLGIALAAQGRLSEAAYSFARAVTLQPNFPAAQRNLEAAQRDLAAKDAKPPG